MLIHPPHTRGTARVFTQAVPVFTFRTRKARFHISGTSVYAPLGFAETRKTRATN